MDKQTLQQSDSTIITALNQCISLLKTHDSIISSYVSDYFARNLQTNIKEKWRESLNTLPLSSLAALLNGGKLSSDKVLPLSLLSYHAAVNTLQLPWNKSLNIGQGHKLPTPSQLKEVRCRYRKHLKPKKEHEIKRLGAVIESVSHSCSSRHVVDIGGGHGHLARHLTFNSGLTVTTIDRDDLHAPLATKYDQEALRDVQRLEPERLSSVVLPSHRVLCIDPTTTADTFSNFLHSQGFDESPFVITGLHACGSLTPTLLRLYVSSPRASALVSVGCCYMKEEPPGLSFPMSNYIRQHHPDLRLSYEALELACHFTHDYIHKLYANDPALFKSQAYRAALQTIILDKNPEFITGGTGLNVRRANEMTFESYSAVCLEKLGLSPDISSEQLSRAKQHISEWRSVVNYYVLRLAVAPAIEAVVLLDRLLYLAESGFSCQLLPVFDPSLSPRSFAIVSIK